MAVREPLSPHVEVFMTEEEALWAEWERGDDSKQGSITERIIPFTILSAWAMSNIEAGQAGVT